MVKRRFNFDSEIAQRTAQVIVDDYEEGILEAAEEAREVAIEHYEKLLDRLKTHGVNNRFAGYEVVYRPQKGLRVTLPGTGQRVTLPTFYVTIDGDTNGYNLFAILDEGRKPIVVPEGKFIPFRPLRTRNSNNPYILPPLDPMTSPGSLDTKPPREVNPAGVMGPHVISAVAPRDFTTLLAEDINEELRGRDNPIRFDVSRRET